MRALILFAFAFLLGALGYGFFAETPEAPSAPAVAAVGSIVETHEDTEKTRTPPPTSAQTYRVLKVVDGDTVALEMDGKSVTVRLIGLDTPETVDPRTSVQCFGVEASNKAKELLTDARVVFETDSSQGTLDKYGRALGYIILADGTLFNEYMISEGYAYEYTYKTPYRHQARFKAAQERARAAKKGLWADGACAADEPQKNAPSAGAAGAALAGEYNCTTNTYNCTSFKAQSEAQAAFEACGGSANDIHKLDSDKDGVVCESLP